MYIIVCILHYISVCVGLDLYVSLYISISLDMPNSGQGTGRRTMEGKIPSRRDQGHSSLKSAGEVGICILL